MSHHMEKMKDKILESLEDAKTINKEQIVSVIEETVFLYVAEKYKSRSYIKESIGVIEADLTGFGILQPLFDDATVTEIMVNANEVFFEREGHLQKSELVLESKSELMGIIRSICRRTGRPANTAVPITDACLDDGTRINIVMEPIAVDGCALTIRKFPEEPYTESDLITNNFCTKEAFDFLRHAYGARYNMFICGGAGSGKTTLLNILANFTGDNERIVTIEDSAELKIKRVKNLVRLETRKKNSEDKGEITIRDLIRTSLRMRPDRIIVGEVRGEETFDMLQAMNTGHEGSISTGHANSTHELIARLGNLLMTDRQMQPEAARFQVAMAIDIIIGLSRPGGRRRVTEISEVCLSPDGYRINDLFTFDYINNTLLRTGEMVDTGKFDRYEQS